jgi:hypothetical protein
MSNVREGRAAASRLGVASIVAVAAALSIAACGNKETPAQSAAATAATKDGQILVRAKNVRWGDAPPGLPSGA